MKVPITRLIPHPQATSKATEAMKQKLLAHIQATSLYPPIVVRSLRKSKSFHNNNGHLQIIDGHLRFEILKELKITHANVVNFGDISDRKTQLLLLTLNKLHSSDDPQKRAQLVKTYAKKEKLSAGDLQAILPDTKRTLEKLLDLADTPPQICKAAKTPQTAKPLAVYLTESQHKLITNALNAAKKQFNHRKTSDALEALARTFLADDIEVSTTSGRDPHDS